MTSRWRLRRRSALSTLPLAGSLRLGSHTGGYLNQSFIVAATRRSTFRIFTVLRTTTTLPRGNDNRDGDPLLGSEQESSFVAADW